MDPLISTSTAFILFLYLLQDYLNLTFHSSYIPCYFSSEIKFNQWLREEIHELSGEIEKRRMMEEFLTRPAACDRFF